MPFARFVLGDDVKAIDLLVKLLLGGGSLVGLVRFIRGRNPDIVRNVGSRLQYRLEGEEIIVERSVHKLYQSKRVTRKLAQFIEPLRTDTIDRLTIAAPGQDEATLTPQDRQYLDESDGKEPILDEVTAMRLRIEAIRWRSERWEFSHPSTGYLWAEIRDKSFLRRVDEPREHMAKGDILEADVRIQQWEGNDGSFRTRHIIENVIDHLPGDEGTQLSIDDSGTSDGGPE